MHETIKVVSNVAYKKHPSAYGDLEQLLTKPRHPGRSSATTNVCKRTSTSSTTSSSR